MSEKLGKIVWLILIFCFLAVNTDCVCKCSKKHLNTTPIAVLISDGEKHSIPVYLTTQDLLTVYLEVEMNAIAIEMKKDGETLWNYPWIEPEQNFMQNFSVSLNGSYTIELLNPKESSSIILTYATVEGYYSVTPRVENQVDILLEPTQIGDGYGLVFDDVTLLTLSFMSLFIFFIVAIYYIRRKPESPTRKKYQEDMTYDRYQSTGQVDVDWTGLFPPAEKKVTPHPETPPKQKENVTQSNIEELIGRISDKSSLTNTEVKKRIEEKLEDLGFFVNDIAAAHIVAKDLGVSLGHRSEVFLTETHPYPTEKGYNVRSKAEQLIDNTLTALGINHLYEPRITLSGKSILPDWYLPEYDAYIEYWGMEGKPEYDRRKMRKLELYTEHKKQVLSIKRRHLSPLNRLETRIRNFLSKIK